MRWRWILPLAALASAGLVAAGCGSQGTTRAVPETVEGTLPTTTQPSPASGDAKAGAKVFQSAGCGSCHTLAAAGSRGMVGPNLDQAKPSFDLVVDRVTNGKGVMPSFRGQLSEKQIADVAAYVVQSTRG
ncbi:MAG: sulfide dehydrogenase [Thermoleophilia bacterium]